MSKQYQFTEQDDIQILYVNNLLNEFDNRTIIESVDEKIDAGFANFIVDLSGIKYMNSVGINFLILMKQRSEESGGTIAVANASGKVKQLLDITKLRPMFYLADSLEDAIEFIKAGES
jgi:anti-sigma B factor antagonist